MKNKTKINKIISNDKYLLVISFVLAFFVWLGVIINVSPETTRTINNVKVVIDDTVPSQFGLEVFGDKEFYVDVTVTGKKYQISNASLSADDILVTAQTSNVDSAGTRTLLLKAESASGSDNYRISSISQRSIDVYFDSLKTVQMVIEPEVITDGFEIVNTGFEMGAINLSESSVTISGPSTEVNKIEKVVARLPLEAPLSSNKSANTEIVLLDENQNSKFKYVSTNINSVVLTIPVLKVKALPTTVLFKNAPDDYVLTPLKYTISPYKDYFNILVDEYDKTTDYSVGTIDFKSISPTNNQFEFLREDLTVSNNSSTQKFVVKVDVSDLSQEYFTIPGEKVKINSTQKTDCQILGLNKSVVVVGTEKNLESITMDDITVEIDITGISVDKGQRVTVPANVTINSANCWVYGSYTVDLIF